MINREMHQRVAHEFLRRAVRQSRRASRELRLARRGGLPEVIGDAQTQVSMAQREWRAARDIVRYRLVMVSDNGAGQAQTVVGNRVHLNQDGGYVRGQRLDRDQARRYIRSISPTLVQVFLEYARRDET